MEAEIIGGRPSAGSILVDGREIGRVRGEAAGPTVIAIAGIHGNEPAGIAAARRVFARLFVGDIPLRGEFVVHAGNLAALQQGVRYQAKDLNRQWTEAHVAAVRASGPQDPEDRELLELISLIEKDAASSRGRTHLIDLHTTSAAGIPFVLFGDTLPQRRFVQVFPIPIIIGLEEQVDGVLTAYWTRRGLVTFACEGGQHADPVTIDSLEAVLWLSLSQAGLVSAEAAIEVARSVALLDRQRADVPRTLEVVSRRAISAEDAFRMEPGFRNIDHAREGQLLARDRSGEIRAPSDGVVIMPLYQGLGGDGYFWGRAVSRVRIKTSEVLRKLGADRLLSLLPGVARDRDNPARFIVDTQVARLYPLDVFHLFGYRKVRARGTSLTVERQPG